MPFERLLHHEREVTATIDGDYYTALVGDELVGARLGITLNRPGFRIARA
jgi:hypothetical protein